MDLDFSELLQLLGAKEMDIYVLRKEIARLQTQLKLLSVAPPGKVD